MDTQVLMTAEQPGHLCLGPKRPYHSFREGSSAVLAWGKVFVGSAARGSCAHSGLRCDELDVHRRTPPCPTGTIARRTLPRLDYEDGQWSLKLVHTSPSSFYVCPGAHGRSCVPWAGGYSCAGGASAGTAAGAASWPARSFAISRCSSVARSSRIRSCSVRRCSNVSNRATCRCNL